ncbi:MAG: zinc carboxypeptidase, partial [Verrucomicrobiae bacterium]|nr:zinc carboxypeptidase [Verrucomicrobiae bacterium]
DLHNPGPGDKQPFFFGPFDYETLPAPVHAQYRRWITLAGTEIKGPLPVQKDYRFATYVKTDEERARMSSGWVRNHTDPHRVISVTLETAWNTPASTAEGYLTVGGQLGRTVARYLEKE